MKIFSDTTSWLVVQSTNTWTVSVSITIRLFNIAMENGPFIDGLPINSMVMFHSYEAMLVITRGYPLNWSQKFQTANAANGNNRTLSQFYPKFSPKNHGSSSSWLAKVLQWQVLVGDAKRSKHHLSGPRYQGPSPSQGVPQKGSPFGKYDASGLWLWHD